MPTRPISDKEYRSKFVNVRSAKGKKINEKALERALYFRSFEIDLYWRRATYYWTFIAATLAGFVAIQASATTNKEDLSVLLCNLGIVFSFGWLCANRGSKHWQENWENHVDMLEDPVQGPLYKVILTRGESKGISEVLTHLATGPSPLSVSKINQLISLFVTEIWVGLLFYSLPPIRTESPLNWYYIGITSLAIITCVAFVTLGRTYPGGYWHRGSIRTTKINNDPKA